MNRNVIRCAGCTGICDSLDGCGHLTCDQCSIHVHTRCLKGGRVPGGLLGDVFFKFICSKCNANGEELVTREKLSWFTVITIVLYNLAQTLSKTDSRKGYYHYRQHICEFIDLHFDTLLKVNGQTCRRTKKWKGTVAGVLSNYQPKFFKSGSAELMEPGYWKLARNNIPPKVLIDDYQKYASEEKSREKLKLADRKLHTRQQSLLESTSNHFSFDVPSTSFDHSSQHSQDLVYDSLEQHSATPSESYMYSKAYVEPSETLSSFLFDNELEDNISDMEDIDIEGGEALEFSSNFDGDFLIKEEAVENEEYLHSISQKTLPGLRDIKQEAEDIDSSVDPLMKEEEEEYMELSIGKSQSRTTDSEDSQDEEETSDVDSPPTSLFHIKSSSRNDRPWEKNSSFNNINNTDLIAMSEFEESRLYEQLRCGWVNQLLPSDAHRLYRKLSVRRLKRKRNIALFNIDNHLKGNISRQRDFRFVSQDDIRVLDRFQRTPSTRKYQVKTDCPYAVRLTGNLEVANFYSSYTQRVLKAYIRRDLQTTPPWLALMQELLIKSNNNNDNWIQPERWPIDYSYVRPQHIASINCLCEEYFYPGIDLSEALTYPDFSCVALYKRLVVGFAFMVPDAGYNETYISFLFTRPEWRGAGIASFMLYHLIQTCMGKDICLHVSVTNPAVVLYQKFGFKIEEYIQDFYDKYLPVDSKECKHALYLRLKR